MGKTHIQTIKHIKHINKHIKPHISHYSFRRLLKELGRRFDAKEAPSAVRHQLLDARREEGESLDEFAERIQCMVQLALPTLSYRAQAPFAVDCFLRGCREKTAAAFALERQPRSFPRPCRSLNTSWIARRQYTGPDQFPSGRLGRERRLAGSPTPQKKLCPGLRWGSVPPGVTCRSWPSGLRGYLPGIFGPRQQLPVSGAVRRGTSLGTVHTVLE